MSNIKNTTDLFLRKTQTVSIDGRGITGLSSGIEELDRITHGFQEGDLITVAGRPAVGKSSLALSMVKSIAIDHRMPVIYISPSMTGEKIVKRLLSIVCRIPLDTSSAECFRWKNGKTLNEAQQHFGTLLYISLTHQASA